MEIQDAAQNTLSYSGFWAHAVLALFGAIAHAANAHRRGLSKGLADFVMLTFMSSFSGLIFALIALNVFDSPYLTLASAGAGGFLGVEGLTYLAEKIRDSLVAKAK